jgi:hypothetical protein
MSFLKQEEVSLPLRETFPRDGAISMFPLDLPLDWKVYTLCAIMKEKDFSYEDS